LSGEIHQDTNIDAEKGKMREIVSILAFLTFLPQTSLPQSFFPQTSIPSNFISPKLHFPFSPSLKLRFPQISFPSNFISLKLHFPQISFPSNFISPLSPSLKLQDRPNLKGLIERERCFFLVLRLIFYI